MNSHVVVARVEDASGFERSPAIVDVGSPASKALRAIVVVALVLAMGALFWPLFSMGWYGYGDEIYLLLESYRGFFWGLALFSCSMVMGLAVLDIGYWSGPAWYVGQLLVVITMTGFMLAALAFTSSFPAAPVAVYLLLCPIVLFVAFKTVLRGMAPATFVFWTAVGTIIVAAMSLVAWAVWISQNHLWNEPTKLEFFTRLNCTSAGQYVGLPSANLTELIKTIDAAGHCDMAQLYWLTPLLLFVFCAFMGAGLFFIWHSQRTYEEKKTHFDGKVTMFIAFVCMALLGLWISAGIAATQANLATIVFTFAFLFLVVGTTALILVAGIDTIKQELATTPIVQKFLESTESDWMRSLILFCLAPLSLAAFPLSFLRQLSRKYLPFAKTISPKEAQLVFTLDVSSLLYAMRRWHWGSILTKIIWWGLIFDIVSVAVARLMHLFFSWLNDQFISSGMGLAEVTLIFIFTCVLIFQFPPTPGLPIYISAGVIIVDAAEKHGWNFWVAWWFSTCIGVFLKYTSLISGMLIGQLWGKVSVGIRRTVGVNSTEIRAMKFILEAKGVTWAQMAILCGGPDWPLAVLAGILRTSYIKNCIGSLSLFILVIPASLSGALILHAGESAVSSTGSTLALSVAVLFQGLSMMFALHAIGTAAEVHKDELAAWPLDQQVAELEEASAVRWHARRYIYQWKFVPKWLKFLVYIAVIMETASAYLFLLFGHRCFVHFTVTDHINVDLNGHAINVVKPLGWVGIGLCMGGIFVLIVLGRWISFQMSPDKVEASEAERKKKSNDAEKANAPKPDDDDNDDLVSLYTGRYRRVFGACGD